MLILRGSALGLLQFVVVAALLILPAGLFAGQWVWPRGWAVLAAYALVQQASIVFLALCAPESLEARLRPLSGASQPPEDRTATALIILTASVCLIVVPVDTLIWQVLPATGVVTGLAGGGVALAGYGLIIRTLFENRFAIPVVDDQADQGQQLVDTGPYAYVRHPMYLGALLFLIGLGPCLGSFASLFAVLPVFLALAWRVRIEERLLIDTLEGYTAYRTRVPYRIVPLVW